jgi:death-on-curing family protein
MTENILQSLAIYQTLEGEIRLKEDLENETIWASLDQISFLFGRDKSVISRHLKNIFNEEELNEKMVVAFFATTKKHGYGEGKTQTKDVKYFNLDVIISVGYRVNSKVATNFRKWATKTLKEHITQGFTINKKVLEKNYQKFLEVVDDIKILSEKSSLIQTDEALELIKSFSSTWFSLESYDKQALPSQGEIEEEREVLAQELYEDVETLKKELIAKKEATELFAQEKNSGNLEGILGNVLQSAFGQDVYPTVEEKAAHLMYFIIKNHPFNDGNKRTGAFAFIWYLQKSKYRFREKISPETLTLIALFIAESPPQNKEKMIGLVLLLLKGED